MSTTLSPTIPDLERRAACGLSAADVYRLALSRDWPLRFKSGEHLVYALMAYDTIFYIGVTNGWAGLKTRLSGHRGTARMERKQFAYVQPVTEYLRSIPERAVTIHPVYVTTKRREALDIEKELINLMPNPYNVAGRR